MVNEPGLLLVGVIFTLIGLWLLWKVVINRLQATREVFGMADFDPFATDQRGNLVMARGTIAAKDETIESPMTDDECVAYERKEEELHEVIKRNTVRISRNPSRMKSLRKRMRKDEDDLRWKWVTLDSSSGEVPFYVETENGTVEVDPPDAKLDVSQEVSKSTSRTRKIIYKALPQNRHLRGLISNPKREFENHISPRDEVLVMGDIRPPDSADTDAVGTVSGEGEKKFLITTRSKLGIVFRSVVKTTLLVLLMLLFLLLGVFLFSLAF